MIPGNGENLKSRDYQAVLDIYEGLGYEPHFVSIKWKYRTIDDWVEQISSKISGQELQDSLLSGFSFGSMIALSLAAKVNPKKLLLFSLSPYFKEDFPLPEKYKQWAGKRRVENFKRLSMDEMAAKINCPTTIFIGKKEIDKHKDMELRSSRAHEKIKHSRLIVVKDVSHDVGDPKYVKSIKDSLNT
ncbi:MAG TPA: hypothetical protein VI336_02285 [Candidatus Saccharimonadales bacterium]|nr:hypothetical protein [Candidatus Saccharimonadales bacterium]